MPVGQVHQEDAEPTQEHGGFAPTHQPASQGWGRDAGGGHTSPALDFGNYLRKMH